MLDLGLFILRVPYSLALLWFHGRGEAQTAWQHMSSENPAPWPLLELLKNAGLSLPAAAPTGVLALGLIGASLLLLGFATRLAAFLLLLALAGVAWVFWKNALWGALETTLVYALISFALIFIGSGRSGLDWFFRSREKPIDSYLA